MALVQLASAMSKHQLQTLTRPFPQMIRDCFTISTWLSIGAVIQGLLVYFVRPTYAVAPAALILLYKLSRTTLQSFGLLRNPYMDDVIMGKFSAQHGDAAGNAPTEGSQNQIAIIQLASRSNQWVIPSMGLHMSTFSQLGMTADMALL